MTCINGKVLIAKVSKVMQTGFKFWHHLSSAIPSLHFTLQISNLFKYELIRFSEKAKFSYIMHESISAILKCWWAHIEWNRFVGKWWKSWENFNRRKQTVWKLKVKLLFEYIFRDKRSLNDYSNETNGALTIIFVHSENNLLQLISEK